MSRKTKTVKVEVSDIVVGNNDNKTDQTPVSCTYKVITSGRVVVRDTFKSVLSGRRSRALRAKGDVNTKQRAARRLIESLLIHTATTTVTLDDAKLVRIVTPVKVSPLTKQIVTVLAESLGFDYVLEVKE